MISDFWGGHILLWNEGIISSIFGAQVTLLSAANNPPMDVSKTAATGCSFDLCLLHASLFLPAVGVGRG